MGTIPPVGIGIFLRYKFPKHADLPAKIFSTIGAIAIVVVAGISIYVYRESFNVIWQQLVIAAIFPVLGLLLGYGLASLVSLYNPFRLKHPQRRTISFETGIQNTQLATAIIQLSGYTPDIIGRMVLFPVIYLGFQLVWLVIIIIAYRVYLKKMGRADEIRTRKTKLDGKVKGQKNDAYEKETPAVEYKNGDAYSTEF